MMSGCICVFCSSSNAVAAPFMESAIRLGTLIASNGMSLVYGGGKTGLMGETARAVQRQGGKVIGVIPGYLNTPRLAFDQADELLVTSDLRQRKAVMESRADAFISLAGGFGTLEETVEVIALKQLGRHTKPIIIINTLGFYDPLLAMFDSMFKNKFIRECHRALYDAVDTPESAVDGLPVV
ncbi:MAG: TIGR00730 family Rossman fold protein [Verrucomicrobia bacterium]|nr:TIGR00730 family Rossman fold protein [Verrucomicrobiota bacterium]MCF7709314.1 TIGR00730 family Rossman fold protein [Verrucomicrobiota bacterium]